jgi:hypothetical protein
MRALPLLLLPRLINILQDEHGAIKSRTVEMTTGASELSNELQNVESDCLQALLVLLLWRK